MLRSHIPRFLTQQASLTNLFSIRHDLQPTQSYQRYPTRCSSLLFSLSLSWPLLPQPFVQTSEMTVQSAKLVSSAMTTLLNTHIGVQLSIVLVVQV